MTPTAIELWNDKRFIEKRMREQVVYCDQLNWRHFRGEINYNRYLDLMEGADYLAKYFRDRLIQLNHDRQF